MNLSRKNLTQICAPEVILPPAEVFDLPVRVLQFGTGILLRGLPDFFIDKANRQGIFNGRIVVVKSTESGNTDVFQQQDGLYTLIIKGLQDGVDVEEKIVCSAISHVLSASKEWREILKEILNPELKIIISNTTEIGIQFVEESIFQSPPVSFPARLLALLYERYTAFQGGAESGFVIIPTELVPNNGSLLQEILNQLARFNKLGPDFELWLNHSNLFCNSLVDCIITGKPSVDDARIFERDLGYQDNLMTVSEAYRLWAIEGDKNLRMKLGFEKADDGVVIVDDIQKYRELKLRLLNGTHTACCALGILAGFDTVKNALEDNSFSKFVQLLMDEISTAIPYPIDQGEKHKFSQNVLERFKNPYIGHLWITIAQQSSAKFKLRVLPLLQHYFKKYKSIPLKITLGFAAYLVLMRPLKEVNGQFYGCYNDIRYPIIDEKAERLFEAYQNKSSVQDVVYSILRDIDLWGTDLTLIDGFSDKICDYYQQILNRDIAYLIQNELI